MAVAPTNPERLLLEMQHRVKNMAAVVRSLARRTASTSADLEEFQGRFDGRLGALVRAHTAMARSAPFGVDLEELVRDTLLAEALVRENWTVNGPAVRLPPLVTEMFALLLHELALESALAGALGDAVAELRVGWAASATTLSFSWREVRMSGRGSPVDFAFGRELLEEGLPYQFKAKAVFSVNDNGVTCEVMLPLQSSS